MTFQEWCKEILPIIKAGAQGEEIEYMSTSTGVWPWLKKESAGMEGAFIYRIKPRTVNGFEVPKAVLESLDEDQEYFVPSPSNYKLFDKCYWDTDNTDCINHLSRGIVHITKEAAIAHAKAMVGINPNTEQGE